MLISSLHPPQIFTICIFISALQAIIEIIKDIWSFQLQFMYFGVYY
mgnify:CR=1 FL=1